MVLVAIWHKYRRKRTTCHYHLLGLDKAEAKPYIAHHLALAGRTGTLFSEEVIEEIFQQAKRIPRLINNLCYACLLEIYQQNKSVVDTQPLEKILIKWDL